MLLSMIGRAWRDAPVERIALLLAFAGLSAVAIGFLTHAQPYAATLGYDSAMTVGVLAFAFALAHGVGYRRSVEILAPLVALQIVSAVRQGVSLAPMGTELVIFSAVGFVLLAADRRLSLSRRPLT